MRARAVATSFLILLAACGTPDADEPVVDPGAEVIVEPVSNVSIADFTGTWENTVRLEGVDEPVPSTMTARASDDDWTMSLEGRDSIPLEVSLVGDSLITQSAEYESVLRPGVMVTVRTSSTLQGDMMMGNVVATYRTPQGEERVPGTIEGRRAQ
jgi:hypothetical protein